MEINMMLEQCLGSAVRYIQDNAGEYEALYFDDLPENFMVPSIYFPVPKTSSRKVTFQTYLTTIYMEAWFMASADWIAYANASNVRDCLVLNDCAFNIVEKDGKALGKGIRVDNIEVDPIGTGVVKLSFAIKDYFSKEKNELKANNISFSGPVKAYELLGAWYSATEEQRKIEEVQKECLEKALKYL